jgi:predicted nucleotidyltransferase
LSPEVFRHVDGLPDHRRVLAAVLEFFRPQAIAAWVSGSVASGGMDEESDLDVGICFADGDRSREAAWARRWEWEIAPSFHRFDADHVKPYFVIYLFDPKVKTDIPLHTLDDLPAAEGSPYVLAWDDSGRLADWAATAVPAPPEVDWTPAVHEEERFWAWLVYSLQHVRRAEYYSIAADFWYLRDVVEQWQARLAGLPRFAIRRTERSLDRPERAELVRALRRLVEIHDRQRAQLDLSWRTSEAARARIRAWIAQL